MFNWAASAGGEPVSWAAAGRVHMQQKSIRVAADQHQCCPSPLLPCLDPFEDSCFSIKCSPGHSSPLLLPLLSASLLSPRFRLCLSARLSEIGGRLWSPFKIIVFFCACCFFFFSLQCSGYRWVASGCQSARPIKTDSSCRCLKTVADRVTQQFTGVSGKNSVRPYGEWVESGTLLTLITFKWLIYLFLICKWRRNYPLVAFLFRGCLLQHWQSDFTACPVFRSNLMNILYSKPTKGTKTLTSTVRGKVARNVLAA